MPWSAAHGASARPCRPSGRRRGAWSARSCGRISSRAHDAALCSEALMPGSSTSRIARSRAASSLAVSSATLPSKASNTLRSSQGSMPSAPSPSPLPAGRDSCASPASMELSTEAYQRSAGCSDACAPATAASSCATTRGRPVPAALDTPMASRKCLCRGCVGAPASAAAARGEHASTRSPPVGSARPGNISLCASAATRDNTRPSSAAAMSAMSCGAVRSASKASHLVQITLSRARSPSLVRCCLRQSAKAASSSGQLSGVTTTQS
mmetsp:Transcript_35004/g.89537  ORF Transcript_35004/g.89537 Transcript_35004/m.89537 type:complete len:267 (-) Transcript_35004:1113-1913(-)